MHAFMKKTDAGRLKKHRNSGIKCHSERRLSD
jgi:hypothetical protein